MKLLLVAIGALIVGAAAVMLVISRGGALPEAPVALAWEREPCAQCHHAIGSEVSAAELVTSDGSVLAFDTPGCALSYLRTRKPHVHRLWFHVGPDWLGGDDVRFAANGVTLVERGAAGARTLAQVLSSM
ncbi:MAG: hypothetical protein U1F43_09380 [Myxococcota bacterium]